ncbi:purine nucleoside permease [Trametes maxima]|nr:purine nucleoside permease [Trametes maxima]
MLRFLTLLLFSFSLWLASGPTAVGAAPTSLELRGDKIHPKVFIIGMFDQEGSAWHGIPEFNILERNITVPGFSPRFPDAHCTKDGSICQVVADEGEVNAAATITALAFSSHFNLSKTYFLLAGIAGISPKVGTLGSVTFARYAVQVSLQYEIDAREKPAEFPTGYLPQGSKTPEQYPQTLYGTEVFEVNDDLRQLAMDLAKTGKLTDGSAVQTYRAQYAAHPEYAAGAAAPSVIGCDTATSDTFWTGALLADAFANTTALFTNGTGKYCTSQQEDNAVLGSLLRAALAGRADFARVLVMRVGSDFDRPFPGQNVTTNLFNLSTGFGTAISNLRAAGVPVVTGIVDQWKATYKKGVAPSNYIGDIWGSLGGKPDFGPGTASA